MKTRIFPAAILLALLLAANQAHATTILFDALGAGELQQFQHIDYIGTYTTNGSLLTSFSVAFGDCEDCLYDRPVGIGSLPDGIGIFHERVDAHSGHGQLNYYPASRHFDSFVGRSGSYCVVGIDVRCADIATVREPSALWLVIMGASMIAFSRRLMI